MNNEGMQGLIDEFGERIAIIIFDNDSKIYVGYPSSPCKSIKDIELRTIGGVDFLFAPYVPMNTKSARDGYRGKLCYATECVQMVIMAEENCPDFRPDVFDFR